MRQTEALYKCDSRLATLPPERLCVFSCRAARSKQRDYGERRFAFERCIRGERCGRRDIKVSRHTHAHAILFLAPRAQNILISSRCSNLPQKLFRQVSARVAPFFYSHSVLQPPPPPPKGKPAVAPDDFSFLSQIESSIALQATSSLDQLFYDPSSLFNFAT